MEKFKFGFLSIVCAIAFLSGLNSDLYFGQISNISGFENYSGYSLKQIQNSFNLEQNNQIRYNGYNPYRKKKC